MHGPHISKRMVIKGPRKSRNKVMLGRACFAPYSRFIQPGQAAGFLLDKWLFPVVCLHFI